MGNSNRHNGHKGGGGVDNGGSAISSTMSVQHVQSLPREYNVKGRSQQHLLPANKVLHNGGFKVLPERIPGQKLRLTDNGNVLHNGGTLSGRREGMLDHREVDPEFLKVLMRRRSDSVQDLRLDEEDEDSSSRMTAASSSLLAKKYHSNPDLLSDHRNIDVNPSPSNKNAKKKMLRKTKLMAPADQSYVNGGNERRRGLAGFLKSPSNKKSANPSMCHYHNDDSQSLPIVPNPPPPPSARVNADVVAAKLDSRDKSVTYLLERRRPVIVQSATSGCNGSVLSAASAPYVPSRYDPQKRQTIDDARFSSSRVPDNYRGHQSSSSDLQTRVQSMDNLDQSNRFMDGSRFFQPNGLKNNNLKESSMPLATSNVPLGRRLSNRSGRPSNDAGTTAETPRSYFYGGKPPTTGYSRKGELSPDSGSLDRRHSKNFTRIPSNLTIERSPVIQENRRSDITMTDSSNDKKHGLQPVLENGVGSKRRPGVRDVVDPVSSEDEMDISMQLRPMLPKRLPTLPRFAPTQVWRSFSLEDVVAGLTADRGMADQKHDDRCSASEDEEEGDVFEDRIHRIARPMAPPRSNNEKSGDSGISPGAQSPTPAAPLYDFNAVLIPDKQLGSGSDSMPVSRRQSLSPVAATLLRQKRANRLPAPISPQFKAPMSGFIPMWTPEEDLASDFEGAEHNASAIDVNHHKITTQPKLTSRKDMFFIRRLSEEHLDVDNPTITTTILDDKISPSPQKYNSIRKLKRSLSGAMQATGNGRLRPLNEAPTSLDENWSLSRSLPNSLHSHDRLEGGDHQRVSSGIEDKVPPPPTKPMQSTLPRSESGPVFPMSAMHERRSFADLEGRTFADHRRITPINKIGVKNQPDGQPTDNRNGRIVYLPKYRATEIMEENDSHRRSHSDLGTSSGGYSSAFEGKRKSKSKFAYQSTVRQIERKQLERKLSQVVAVKEKQRNREMDLVNKVEEEFQRKRDREKANIRQQLKSLSMDDQDDIDDRRYERDEIMTRLPRQDAYVTENKLHDNRYDNGRQYRYSDGPYADTDKNAPSGSSIFSGIGKWMKRQQRIESKSSSNDHQGYNYGRSLYRQAPEGSSAPSSPGNLDADGNPIKMNDIPPHVNTNPNRSQVVIGAKFSSGRTPNFLTGTGATSPATATIHRPDESNHSNRIWIT